MWLKKDAFDGSDNQLMPYIRGGAISYKVNLKKMSCGCVAGIYAVNSSQWCVEAEQANNYPMCASIDIM